MKGQLDGRTALISGALGDIGTAIARELASRGANIALGDVREESAAQALLDELQGSGVRARYDRCDVSDPEAVQGWLQAVEGDLGVPSLIVPNAAIVTLTNLRTITPDDWNRHLNINLSGAFYMAQAAALRLVDAGMPGRIVFIGSWVAYMADPRIIPYCVSKAGLRMVMKAMAKELAPNDILVNEVAPGFVDAGVSAQVFREQPGRREAAAARVPVQRMITPEEVAYQVAHLCDPRTNQTTGSVLLMDGGLSL
jgi:NAD(P)-dependent dehydrogenase (short-subunit alcohol dehydrogenase family)